MLVCEMRICDTGMGRKAPTKTEELKIQMCKKATHAIQSLNIAQKNEERMVKYENKMNLELAMPGETGEMRYGTKKAKQ